MDLLISKLGQPLYNIEIVIGLRDECLTVIKELKSGKVHLDEAIAMLDIIEEMTRLLYFDEPHVLLNGTEDSSSPDINDQKRSCAVSTACLRQCILDSLDLQCYLLEVSARNVISP